MALRTCCLRDLETTADVLTWSNGLQMVGVDTGSVTAEMVELHPLRNGTDQGPVSGAMGTLQPTVDPCDPVAVATSAGPLPAVSNVDL
jgi:hypothetical protein